MNLYNRKEALIEMLWHKIVYVTDSSRISHEVVYWGDIKEVIDRFYQLLNWMEEGCSSCGLCKTEAVQSMTIGFCSRAKRKEE